MIGLAAQTVFRIEGFKFGSLPFAFKGPIQASIAQSTPSFGLDLEDYGFKFGPHASVLEAPAVHQSRLFSKITINIRRSLIKHSSE